MADYVTRLQNEVNGMCSLFFNFAGALQRDAPKASVGGETITQESTFNVEEQSKMMADQLMEASREIDRIVSKLPPLGRSTQDRQKKIVEMWKEKIALEEALKAEAEELEMVMSELREVHGTLVEDIVTENAESSESESDSEKNSNGADSSGSDSDEEGHNNGDGNDPGQENINEGEQGGDPGTDGGEPTEGPTTSGQDQLPDSNGALPDHGMKEQGSQKESRVAESEVMGSAERSSDGGADVGLGKKRCMGDRSEDEPARQMCGDDGFRGNRGVGSLAKKHKPIEMGCAEHRTMLSA
ncbi:hypothetical protein BSKO_10506 [Bryopsis sp. KO-2023]|nr:hypothetical protein BSKO_10506 [Bryopsis sp. KO-2023]